MGTAPRHSTVQNTGPRHAAPAGPLLRRRFLVGLLAFSVVALVLVATSPGIQGLGGMFQPDGSSQLAAAADTDTGSSPTRFSLSSTPRATVSPSPAPTESSSTASRSRTRSPAPTPTPTRSRTPKPPTTEPEPVKKPPVPAPSSPRPATRSAAPSGPAAQVVELVNAERAKAGCAPLRVDSRLTASAQGHSEDMAANDYMEHTSRDGRSPFDRMKAAGYPEGLAGENIAAGQRDAASVMQSWMESPGHRANILNCGFKDIGVGVAEGGSYGIYWTQNFGGG